MNRSSTKPVPAKRSEIIDGFMIKYHANGRTRWSKGKISNGQPHGYWEWYRPDGTLKRSGHFDEGEPVGAWTTYDEKGQVYKVTTKKPPAAASGARDKRNSMPSAETQLRSFIERFKPAHQKHIRSIRNALRKRFPTANELAYDYSRFFVIAYSPTDRPTDAILSIAARADGVDLYFNQGPRLPDPKKLLRGSGKQVRFIRLESARHLAHPDVAALIAAAFDHASVPLPSHQAGKLIIKTNKALASKKPPRRKSSARAAVA